jgi:ADP-ribose pyrophosphatase YjhB (NUDIX family)
MKLTAKQHLQYMKHLPGRASSATLLLENAAGELLIVKANYKEHWTTPGGVVEENEMPLAAALRETREEIGVAIDSKAVEFVAVAVRTGSQLITYQFIFQARLPESAAISLQEHEIQEYTFVTRQQVATNDRYYGEVIYTWAHGRTGYIEQAFETRAE